MLQGFLNGLTAYGNALRLISRLGLWKYFLVPGVISVLLAIGIFGSAWGASDDIGRWLISFYPFEWGHAFLKGMATLLGGLFILAIGLVVFKHAVMALASPLMSYLSEKVEKQLSGRQLEVSFTISKMMRDVARGIRINLRNLFWELLFTFILFVLGLFPVFSPFTAVAIFLVQAYYAGFGNLDYLMERHFGVRESIRFVRHNRGLAIGIGTIYLFMIFTIIGFFFALPFSTVAATAEGLKRIQLTPPPNS